MDRFRLEYTPIDDTQKEHVKKIKLKAQELEELYNEALKYNRSKSLSTPIPGKDLPEFSRLFSLAQTDLESSVMWAVKAVTTNIS